MSEIPEHLLTHTEKQRLRWPEDQIKILANLLAFYEETLMAKRIYEVKYEEQTDGSWDGGCETVNVLANGDAQKAVEKARKKTVGRTFTWTDPEDETKEHTSKITDFRLIGVRELARADF